MITRILSDLHLDALAHLVARPQLDQRTSALFWDDPYISQQMLAAHLDPSHDAASRKPETIEQSVAWLMSQLELLPGMRVLDLGCGPGLYSRRFARAGLQVTGVDYARRSIDYATADAAEHGLPIEYRYQNYLEMDDEAAYDVICLIWCDFGALTDCEREALLPRIRRALKSGGAFVFDVFTLQHFAGVAAGRSWEIHPNGGFWRSGAYLELQQIYRYAEADTDLTQYVIITADGEAMPYHIWNRSFSPASITALLSRHGFVVESCWSNLCGLPWEEEAHTLGVIARKGNHSG